MAEVCERLGVNQHKAFWKLYSKLQCHTEILIEKQKHCNCFYTKLMLPSSRYQKVVKNEIIM
jgi:hypothetical protein